AVECIAALKLKHCFFNVEMAWDGRRARIIEVNPRMCGQFADLYQKVNGVNPYTVALALATGDSPQWKPGKGEFKAAASVPLRLFQPTRVAAAPDAQRIDVIESQYPGTMVWNEILAGQA